MNNMKIQYASDLHLEFADNWRYLKAHPLEVTGDILLLWSRIPLEDAYFTEQVISDFRRILYKGELMTHAQFNAEHKRCLTFIKDAVAHSQAVHKIVVTHHVPSFRMLHPKFQGSKANGAFTVELEDYITDSGIDYWIYGHSHTNINARIGNTQCLSNQLGYVFSNEHQDFSHDKHLTI